VVSGCGLVLAACGSSNGASGAVAVKATPPSVAASVSTTTRTTAIAPDTTDPSATVPVPYNTVGAGGAYAAVGSGHDTTSYWIVYHDKWHANAQNYAVVVRVPGGLPVHLAWTGKLFPKPAPTPTGASPVTIVGPTLTAADMHAVHIGLVAIPRSTFLADARGAEVPNRSLTAPHMTAPLAISMGGSPSAGFMYTVAEPTGIAFEQIPLTLSTGAQSGIVGCGPYASNPSEGNRLGIVIGFAASVRTFSVVEDGHEVVTSRPAQDPLVPSMRLFALLLPENVKNLTIVVNGTERDKQDLSLCPPE
jgi:hypothetical protein